MAERNHISPNITFNEVDRSAIPTRNLGVTRLGIIGETVKGPAFTPYLITNYTDYQSVFGSLDPCKFEGTQQPRFESGYIAKQYLSEADQLYVMRVLGLSGYDAGDAWSIKVGGGLDVSSVIETGTENFLVDVEFVNGVVNKVMFNNSTLQTLYNEGKIPNSVWGDVDAETGDTIALSNVFYGNCESFTGARFNAVLTNREEEKVCITGTSISSSGTTITTTEQTCTVIFGNGTVTENSTFVIEVVSAIALVNNSTNDVIVVNSGIVQIEGGTITHNEDDSITIADSTIILSDGTIYIGGSYKICSLEGNDAYYDCNNISGTGYSITTGTTTTSIPSIVTGETTFVADIPSGIVNMEFSGNTVLLSGSPLTQYDDMVVATLRSYATYNSNEVLTFKVAQNNVLISSTGKIDPYDDFTIYGTLTNGQSFSYTVSLDTSKMNYIGRVFAKNSGGLCCQNDVPFYIEEIYQALFDDLAQNSNIDCIKPEVCYTENLGDYQTEYRKAKTPWLVSEVRGNKVFRLFRFHTLSDGNASNDDVKISIENIRLDNKEFDVVVRSFYDTDRRPVVLERFSRVNLSETSNRYIGRVIGTADGTYELQSSYVIVEMAQSCLEDSIPVGFEGYPVRDYGTCVSPMLTYKKEYSSTDRIRKVYLGLSDTVGIEQDLFDFKGLNADGEEWTGMTKGYHLDSEANTVTVEGGPSNIVFEVGAHQFKNETDLEGTNYEKLQARKFTLVFYGGFDGWDIHRKTRTNTDTYDVNGTKGQLGLSVGNFDNYVLDDGTVGITSDFYAYLKGIKLIENPENVNINLLAVPNVNLVENTDLVEEILEIIEDERCDLFYVATTPDYSADGKALLPQDLADSIDGLYDTSYMGTYAYWGQYFDQENNTYLWLPPTAEVMRVFAITDKVSAPWYAGAGINRGITEFIKPRYKTRLAERDTLAEVKINNLFTDQGQTYVFGNKTLLDSESSALTNVNVRRLLIYMKELIKDIGLGLLFEPNDATLAEQFRSQLTPVLNNLRTRRGIYDYRLTIDQSAELVDAGIIKANIQLKPSLPLEEIDVTFTLTATGADFDEA